MRNVASNATPPRRWPNNAEWKDAAECMIYTLGGALLPLWGAFILVSIWSQEFSFSNYAEHGELAIVAAALAAPALYLAGKQPHGVPLRKIVQGGSLVVLLISMACFAGVFVMSRFPPDKLPFQCNTDFLIKVSLMALVASILGLYHATALDLIPDTYDAREVERSEEANLAAEFHKLD